MDRTWLSWSVAGILGDHWMWNTAGRRGAYVEQATPKPIQAQTGNISKPGGVWVRQETALVIATGFSEKHLHGAGAKSCGPEGTPAALQSYGHGAIANVEGNDERNLEELQNQTTGAAGRKVRAGANIHDELMHYRTRAHFP